MVLRWFGWFGPANSTSLLATEEWNRDSLPQLRTLIHRALDIGDGAVARHLSHLLHRLHPAACKGLAV